MRSLKDQLGDVITLPSVPVRIISLVPSQTQLLETLDLEEQVVGITKFCIHPDHWFRTKARVGGTKNIDLDKVRELCPDLIIANKEENVEVQIEALRELAPVWVSDVNTLDEAREMIQAVGEMCDREEKAAALLNQINEVFTTFDVFVQQHPLKGKSVLYAIWHDPMYIAAKDTFIDHMITRCGWVNASSDSRYPEPTRHEAPDFVLLSSEPYPFKDEHIAQYQQRFPKAKIVLVDGEMFSWYGSKLVDFPDYAKQLLDNLAAQ